MKCFEVTINGKRVCTAGIGDDGVLTGILSFVKRKDSPEGTADAEGIQDSESLELRVGGLENRAPGVSEHLKWLNQNLAVGDEIVIRIIEASQCDEPISREEKRIQCSFCKKKQYEVVKLIAGPAVYICNECVHDCLAALATDEPTGTITTIIRKSAEAKCSFCGKSPSEVLGMVGVPAARICNECIKICQEILAADEQSLNEGE
jgi:hypothetical protein